MKKRMFSLLSLLYLIFSYSGMAKTESHKNLWIIKNGTSCFPAVGFMAPEKVMENNPKCRKDTKGFPKGIFVLDCKSTALGTSLGYAETLQICESMVENLKAQGF